MPHFIVDINRDCNITCAACYNRRSFTKTCAQIEADIDAAAGQRLLHTVTLAGGEPTLHPDLSAIIRGIRRRGLRVVLLTNGLTLDDAQLARWREAGVDLILLHIDSGQTRPDLPARPTPGDLDELRRRKLAQIAGQGIDGGLVATLYRRDLDDLDRLVDVLVSSPHARFLLATAHWDASAFRDVRGTVSAGFRAPPAAGPPPPAGAQESVSLRDIGDILARRGMQPFATLGSSRRRDETRWLCYTVAAAGAPGATPAYASLRSGLSDRLLLRLVRGLTGRYIYHVRPNAARFGAQLILNGLSGGRMASNARVLWRAARPGARLEEKRMVFQSGPTRDAGGAIVHCRNCPDATIIDGHLVPICLSDGWVAPR